MKNNKIALVVALIALCAIGTVFAQGQLAVELSHPVYGLIETAELRGVVERLSSVKPYTREQVAGWLRLMAARADVFSKPELAIISEYLADFSEHNGTPGASLWRAPGSGGGSGAAAQGAAIGDAALNGAAAPSAAATGGTAAIGTRIEARSLFDLGHIGDAGADPSKLWHLNSVLKPYIEAAPTSWLSAWGTIGVTYDKVNRDLFMPYSFTKEWDSYHNKVSTSPTTDGEEAYPTWSFDLQNDIAASTPSGSFFFRLSRLRRDWGFGEGSLSLSASARPFMGAEFIFRPSPIFGVSHLVGSLSNWEKGDSPTDSTDTRITSQKMYAIQRLELFPFPWLSFGANSTVVGAKRLELGYLSPMMFALEYQVMVSDIDNMGVEFDGQILLKRLGKLYASFYIDEIELSSIAAWFTRPRNMFAYQGGIKLDVPVLPLSTFTAQYTKVEPFVYAHYPTWTPFSRLAIDNSYTHDGENLGYHIPPNSDELLVKLESVFAPGWRASFAYSMIRHGDNSQANYNAKVPLIYGDTDKYQWYDKIALYPDKNFLHDGVYDYNHSGKLDVAWRPAGGIALGSLRVPAELGFGFGLSYTFWKDGNALGATLPDPEWRRVLELNLKLFM